MPGSVTFDPCRQYRNDISLFFSRQFPPGRDAMPLGQTSPAAAGRGVLGDKDRMPAHRGLPPVIGNNGRSEACAHEICGMTPDSLHAFSLDIGDIFRFQTKSSAELGCRQSGKQRIEGFCRMGIFNHFSPQIKSATKIRTVNAFLSVRTGFSFGIFRKQYQPCQSDGCRQRQNSGRQTKGFQQMDIHGTPTFGVPQASDRI